MTDSRAPPSTSSGMDEELKRHVARNLVKMTSQRFPDKDSSSDESNKGGDPILGGQDGEEEDELKRELRELDKDLTSRVNVSCLLQ